MLRGIALGACAWNSVVSAVGDGVRQFQTALGESQAYLKPDEKGGLSLEPGGMSSALDQPAHGEAVASCGHSSRPLRAAYLKPQFG